MIVKKSDLTGKNLSNYKVIGKLGQGGMATVYKAHELSLNRMVALKVLSSQLTEDEAYIKRFQREAQAAARLNHPNIVQIYAIGEEKGLYYFAMEYIKGKSLAQIRQEEGILTPEKAIPIIKQVAEALAEAHKAGLVHRDIKPSNIMIDAAGRAKVTDFGIAYVIHAQTKLTKDGSIIGTPEYLSPEQCEGKTVDQRSDIYSLGVTLYELLSGKTPYIADTPVSMLMKIVKGEYPPLGDVNPNVPKSLREIVEKMMERDVQKRYQRMEDVIKSLRALELTKQVPTMMVEEPEAPKEAVAVEGKKSNKWAAVIVAAVIVILMGGAFAAKMLIFDKKASSTTSTPVVEEKTAADEQVTPATTDSQPSEETGTQGEVPVTGETSDQEMTSGDQPTETDSQPPEADTTRVAAAEHPSTSGQTGTPTTGSSGPSTTSASTTAPVSTVAASTPGTTGTTPTASRTTAQVKPQPPAKSCIITPFGEGDKANLVTPYVEEILTKKNFIVIDDPSTAARNIADVARNRIVVDVTQTGSTSLNYYGNSSEMYTVRITIKAVNLKTGRTAAGPISQTVQYTALNADEKLKEAVAGLMSRFLPTLEAQSGR